MNEAILYLNEVGKRKNKQKNKTEIPTISRTDIMSGILSSELTDADRSKLSNLYGEIIYSEIKDLKYVSEITVSCQDDLEIYEMLKNLNKKKKTKAQAI